MGCIHAARVGMCPDHTCVLCGLMQDPNHEDLLTEAAGSAPVSRWRKAAGGSGAAATREAWRDSSSGGSPGTGSAPAAAAAAAAGGGGGGAREASLSPNSRGPLITEQLQMLHAFSRRALRAALIAVHLLRMQQGSRPGAAGTLPGEQQQGAASQQAYSFAVSHLLDHLGDVLRGQGVCLAPWYEPWRFKPVRDSHRLLVLQAAQVVGGGWGWVRAGTLHVLLSSIALRDTTNPAAVCVCLRLVAHRRPATAKPSRAPRSGSSPSPSACSPPRCRRQAGKNTACSSTPWLASCPRLGPKGLTARLAW
jgi:hypothetical protein